MARNERMTAEQQLSTNLQTKMYLC